jgi:hypothetical protein
MHTAIAIKSINLKLIDIQLVHFGIYTAFIHATKRSFQKCFEVKKCFRPFQVSKQFEMNYQKEEAKERRRHQNMKETHSIKQVIKISVSADFFLSFARSISSRFRASTRPALNTKRLSS